MDKELKNLFTLLQQASLHFYYMYIVYYIGFIKKDICGQ